MRCTFHDKPRYEWVDEKLSAGSCALLCAASALVTDNKHVVNSGSQYLKGFVRSWGCVVMLVA